MKRKMFTESCFIIAEAGINHNGSLLLAKKLVRAAKKAGADAIKFQTYKAEDLVTKKARQHQEMLKKYELTNKQFIKLKRFCDDVGILFLSTPHTEDAVDFLDDLVDIYKIASGDLNNHLLLKRVSEKNKPILLSTGMASLSEIKETLCFLRDHQNLICVLHCTTAYPCKPKEVNLRALKTIKSIHYSVGYSDHTNGVLAAVAACALGVKVIEKHLTLDKKMPGPDHKASSDPTEFKLMVDKIRETEIILGSKKKEPTKEELKVIRKIRKSIVAREDIPKGTKITKSMITAKRPGTGIPPNQLGKVIGKLTGKCIKKDEQIKNENLDSSSASRR